MSKYLVKYSYSSSDYSELEIPYAFHPECAKILAMAQARTKHPNNKGILVTEVIPQKQTVDDIFNQFNK